MAGSISSLKTMNSSYDAVSKYVRTENNETKRKRLLDIISRNANSRFSLMARNELAQLYSEEGFLD